MSYDLATLNSAVMDVDEISYILSKVTLVEKLIYSGVSKEEVQTAIRYCKSTTKLDIWLESVLKHWVTEPKNSGPHWDVHLRSKAVRRNILRMFENTNLINSTSLSELVSWANS